MIRIANRTNRKILHLNFRTVKNKIQLPPRHNARKRRQFLAVGVDQIGGIHEQFQLAGTGKRIEITGNNDGLCDSLKNPVETG